MIPTLGRITTIPFSFSLANGAEGYQVTGVLSRPFRLTRFYGLAEPTPNQLVIVMPFKWSGTAVPTSGQPSGPTFFDDLISQPQIRLGRIPIDMQLDIREEEYSLILMYCKNNTTTQQQAQVALEIEFQPNA